jgi:hypothetical protein
MVNDRDESIKCIKIWLILMHIFTTILYFILLFPYIVSFANEDFKKWSQEKDHNKSKFKINLILIPEKFL